MKILALHDGGSGCCWWRVMVPLGELAKHDGFEVEYKTAGDQGPEKGHAVSVTLPDLQGYDVIVGQRFNHHSGLQVWRKARGPFNRLVYETDDDVFSITQENWAAYHLYGREDVRDAVTHSAEVADLITVTVPHLAEVMREQTRNPNVVVLPNSIPGWVLEMEREPRERPAVGWQGGASHGVDVGLIADPVRRFLKRFPGWDLALNGTDYRPTFKAGKRVRFAKWIPIMEDAPGYFAAIDFDIGLAPLHITEFAKSKCVDSSMRICTDRGVLRAGELQPGMQVWHGSWRKIEAVRHDVPRPGLMISISDGYQLWLTPEHRMHVNGGWLRADQVRPGDEMTMEPESFGAADRVQVPWPADGRMSRSRPDSLAARRLDPEAYLHATDGPRLVISPRWGRLLGAFAGDGSVGQSQAITISCDGQDADWIAMLMNDWRAAGLNPGTEQVVTFDGKVLRRRSVRVASAHMLRVLASLGVTRLRPSGNPIRVPCVPDVIWHSPRDVVAEFLAGYFESDGYCSGSGVSVVSKTEQLIRDVQRLLLLFGITSAVRSRTHKAQNDFSGTYWHCDLRKDEAAAFAREIGFRSARKRAMLAEVTGRPRSNGQHRITWSRTVEAVRPCMVDPVDIQVEGSVFSLAGFTSHNSNVKVLECAARGIPSIATDCDVYRSFIRHGENGFLVKHDHEWLHFMSILAADGALRAKMGSQAREDARARTAEATWPLWADAYSSLFKYRSV